MSKSNRCSLVMTLNNADVDVCFTFDKGYAATWDEPECEDEAEIYEVWYPINSKDQVNILPVISDEDLENMYDYIYGYKDDGYED